MTSPPNWWISLRGRSTEDEGGNCAVPGNAIEKWNHPTYDELWENCIQPKILQAGLCPDQFRVVWH